MKLDTINSVYFLGIGGIGMSAIARFFLRSGIRVFGYDKTSSELTQLLEQEGANISYTNAHNFSNSIDLCVYTPAIPKNNPVFVRVEESGVPIKKRAEVLGIISNAQPTYAVAGTHGKTTTSAMLSHIFQEVSSSVNAFVGGIMTNYKTNFLFHESAEETVVEADEYDRSFLHLSPKGCVITSVDPDHMDIYATQDEFKQGFAAFAAQTSDFVICHTAVSLGDIKTPVFTYGELNTADFCIVSTAILNGSQNVVVEHKKNRYSFQLALPGMHNALNAVAAFAMAVLAGKPAVDVAKALESFKGVKRRFELVVQNDKTIYIDDYAHHPTELNAAIDAIKSFYPGRHITGIFQPHLYSRTKDFEADFAKALSKLDTLYLLDIYPARELPIEGVSSSALLDKIELENKRLVQKDEVISLVLGKTPEVLVTLGAGDVDRLVEPLKNALKS